MSHYSAMVERLRALSREIIVFRRNATLRYGRREAWPPNVHVIYGGMKRRAAALREVVDPVPGRRTHG